MSYTYLPLRRFFITSRLCPSRRGNKTRSSQSPGASTILSDKNWLMADRRSSFFSAWYAKLWNISSDISVAMLRPISWYWLSSRAGPSSTKMKRTGSRTSVKLPRWQPLASLTNAIAGLSNSSIVPTSTAVDSASEGIRPRISEFVLSSEVEPSSTTGSGANETPTCFSVYVIKRDEDIFRFYRWNSLTTIMTVRNNLFRNVLLRSLEQQNFDLKISNTLSRKTKKPDMRYGWTSLEFASRVFLLKFSWCWCLQRFQHF